jgi:hypothetical protein
MRGPISFDPNKQRMDDALPSDVAGDTRSPELVSRMRITLNVGKILAILLCVLIV